MEEATLILDALDKLHGSFCVHVYMHTNPHYLVDVYIDTKNHFRRAQEVGKSGFSLVTVPRQTLVPKFAEKSMLELPAYLV